MNGFASGVIRARLRHMPLMKSLVSALALCAPLAGLQGASAQECADRGRSPAVTGTLVAPEPCMPARRPGATERGETKSQPGVIRHGNTTIYYGGSLQGETSVRRR